MAGFIEMVNGFAVIGSKQFRELSQGCRGLFPVHRRVILARPVFSRIRHRQCCPQTRHQLAVSLGKGKKQRLNGIPALLL
jgi:hypothetical protein